jgi:hypothetical protein
MQNMTFTFGRARASPHASGHGPSRFWTTLALTLEGLRDGFVLHRRYLALKAQTGSERTALAQAVRELEDRGRRTKS